jgi:site-specific DNA recombinase
MMDAIAYVRISVKDQSVYSLDYQERNIREYCTKNNLRLLALFKDDGESSYTFDRPDWNALERFIKKNKSVSHLIIFDHDRFSRNLAEALMKIKELQDRFGIKVLATTDSINTDFSDPSNFMMRAFKLMIAESELHRIRQRTKTGILQAKLSGRSANRAPFGYINVKGADGRPTLKIDNEKAHIISMIFSQFNNGIPIEEIKKNAKLYGFKQNGNSAIQRILVNPLYAGLVSVPAHAGKPEQLIKAIHPPIVAEGQFWTAQSAIQDNKRKNYHANEEVPLKGIIRCPECGALMSAGNSKGKAGKYYWYYLCATHRVHYSAIKMEQRLGEILDLLSLPDKTINWFIKKLTDKITTHLKERSEKIAITQKALRSVMEKIETIEMKYLEGNTSKGAYLKVIADRRTEQEELQKRIYELGLSDEEYFARLNNIIPKLHDVRGAYETMSLNAKHQFLKLVFKPYLIGERDFFRTQTLEKTFIHNIDVLQEKGLIVLDKKAPINGAEGDQYPEWDQIRTLLYLADLFAA